MLVRVPIDRIHSIYYLGEPASPKISDFLTSPLWGTENSLPDGQANNFSF